MSKAMQPYTTVIRRYGSVPVWNIRGRWSGSLKSHSSFMTKKLSFLKTLWKFIDSFWSYPASARTNEQTNVTDRITSLADVNWETSKFILSAV